MSTLTDVKLKRIHPKKFALWMAIVSMIMFFSAFTSAYIVRKSAGNWLSFPLPVEFYISTITILLSSLCFYISKKAYLEANIKLFKILLFATGIVVILTVLQNNLKIIKLSNKIPVDL